MNFSLISWVGRNEGWRVAIFQKIITRPLIIG
jgi:hypothetical protein